MRIPRGVSARDLMKGLKQFGYEPSRQNGSHIRVTTQSGGQHHVTIPNHSEIRVGTLSAILSDISSHLKITKDELVSLVFFNQK